jgi:hypothetical protein
MNYYLAIIRKIGLKKTGLSVLITLLIIGLSGYLGNVISYDDCFQAAFVCAGMILIFFGVGIGFQEGKSRDFEAAAGFQKLAVASGALYAYAFVLAGIKGLAFLLSNR